MAWNLANDQFIGGGFDIYNAAIFLRYAPDPKDIHAAHSIYFQVLGEQGFVGLFLFLLLWFLVWRSAGWLIREGRRSEDTKWCRNLGAMSQVCLVGYAVGGAFLSLAYFDLPYDILVIVVLTKRWLQEHRASVKATSTIRPTIAGTAAGVHPLRTPDVST
jgi:probable O-glycosylation ligase (exosortase A-associated)